MSRFSPEIEFATNIARESGKVMLAYFEGDQQHEIKEDGSPVTIADKAINRLVIEGLDRAFPADGLIGEEESTADYGPGRRWICDPIDGTISYVQGLPLSMFSLGLVIDGEPQVGVAYDPFGDKMYVAEHGHGARCNEHELRVSDERLDTGVVAITSNIQRISQGIGYVQSLEKRGTYFSAPNGAVCKSVLVAKGKFTSYIEERVSPYDMVAAQLIVEEAGGKVTDLDGNRYNYTRPFKGTIVSNGVVHDELVELVGQSRSQE